MSNNKNVGNEQGPFCESLERRYCLSVPWEVGGVGVFFYNGVIQSHFGVGQVTSDGAASGTRYDMGPSGPGSGTQISITGYENLPNGALRAEFDGTFDEYDEQFGSQFIAENGYSAGWWGGEDHSRIRAELNFLVERGSDLTISDIGGTWAFETLGFGPDRSYLHTGTALFSSSSATVSLAGSPGIPSIYETHSLSRTRSGGWLDFSRSSDDSTLFISRDESVVIWADADYGDADGAIGIGVRPASTVTPESVAGSYRVLFIELTTNGLDYIEERWILELGTDGSFRAFDQAAFDRGSFDVERSGSWDVSGSSIELHDGGANVYTFEVGDNGSNLLATDRTFSGTYQKLFGLGSRVRADYYESGSTVLEVGRTDADGDPLSYDLREDGYWHETDLRVRANGRGPVGASRQFETWLDPVSGMLFGAASASEGLFIYSRADSGIWTVRNLSNDLPGATKLTGEFTVFESRAGRVYVAGVDNVGNLVTFHTTGIGADGQEQWAFTDLVETQLLPKGQSMPPIVGAVISYVTRWDGLNIIGLDADGDIWGIWSGDGGSQWQVSNLSDITGASPLAGGLTAYLTSWDGINIAGRDAGGNLLVTWWVPSFKGKWVTSDLTAVAGGPRFYGENLASFVTPWGGLNIAGLDASGELVIYWWSPALERNGKTWQVAPMTSGLPSDQPRPVQSLSTRIVDIAGGQMNVFGVDPGTSDFVRLHWSPDNPEWVFENLTDVARFG